MLLLQIRQASYGSYTSQHIKEGYHPVLNICVVLSEILHPGLDPLSSRKMVGCGGGWVPRAYKPQGEVSGPGLFQLDRKDANG